ncbi:hypothetical protein B9Z65_1762 [Elsinoe australis]|uniref:D-xylulose reductase n=1 Tax=Elsinoe australis TaxID=40998 RepID=A0A2P7YKT0_9PEZI|nr:hypothetical protein B9Z65_1762 [Elsinoe australis]
MLYGPGDARFEEKPIPSIEHDPHGVLLRIAYTGVCGSDVHFWLHGGINEKVRPGTPMVLGHEATGVVVAVGDRVTTLLAGDEVALEPGFPCRHCSFCLGGKYNFCRRMSFAASPGPGPVAHGTLSRFFVLPEDFCYKLPKHISLDQGVLMEPLAVAIHASRLVDIRPGHNVVVFGAGTVGLLACAVAREFGAAKVIAVDINVDRLQFAKNFAATATYTANSTLDANDNAKMLKDTLLPDGADIIIEATGVASSIQSGIHVIKQGGSYVQVGLGKPKIEFPIVEMSEKEIKMMGCFRYGSGDFVLALSLLERKRIAVGKLITKTVPFEAAVDAWETAKRGEGIKTLIQVQQL